MLGMSGGVDSSVSAFLLKEMGYDVYGIHLHSWDNQDEQYSPKHREFGTIRKACINSEKDWEDVQRVCSILQIPCIRRSYVKEYWTRVFEPFLYQYEHGTTPNPDILCNRHVKFAALQQEAKNLDIQYIATGHYAGIDDYNCKNSLYKLPRRSKDLSKDQSYFLCQIPGSILRNIIFPLSNVNSKKIVREVAERLQLPVYNKEESMGVCFIGERNLKSFLEKYIEAIPGPFISIHDGKILGQHMGLPFYTLGQRANIGGLDRAYYVVKKDSNNTIYVSNDKFHRLLCSKKIITHQFHWIQDIDMKSIQDKQFRTVIRSTDKIGVKTRITSYNHNGLCVFETLDEEFHWASSPGQYIALYDGEFCLGGGQINDTEISL